MSKTQTKELNDISPDISEVDWVIADSTKLQRRINYENVPAVQALLDGKPIEVPVNTSIDRLYRFMAKKGYSLRKRHIQNKLVVWIEPKEAK